MNFISGMRLRIFLFSDAHTQEWKRLQGFEQFQIPFSPRFSQKSHITAIMLQIIGCFGSFGAKIAPKIGLHSKIFTNSLDSGRLGHGLIFTPSQQTSCSSSQPEASSPPLSNGAAGHIYAMRGKSIAIHAINTTTNAETP